MISLAQHLPKPANLVHLRHPPREIPFASDSAVPQSTNEVVPAIH
jgi:hypothetical protein